MTHLGARTAARLLAEEGHTVPLFLFPSEHEKATLPLPPSLRYLKPYLVPGETGPLSWFRSWNRFGPDFPECAARILAEKPDRVILSCFAFCYAGGTLRLAEEIKKRSSVPITVAGSGAAVYPEYFARNPAVSDVFTGEAEKGAPPAVTAGISRETPHTRTAALVISRGCPKGCRFCSNHLSQGRKFRPAPKEAILAALSTLPRDGKRLHLNFEDDNLLFRTGFFLELLEEIRRLYPGTTFTAENGLDYTLMDLPLAEKLAALGFTQFNWSAGSFDPHTLTAENRFFEPERLTALEETAARLGIPSVLYFIAGLAEDTPTGIARSLKEVARRRSLCGISPFYPVPGLPGYEDKTRFDTIDPSLACGSALYPWNGTLTTTQLYTAFRLARLVNLMKNPERVRYRELIEVVQKTGKLHTLAGKPARIIPVPEQDQGMLEEFWDCLSPLRD
jgi:hypothetical protein